MVAEKIKTFSVGYAEAPYSELGYAAQVARSLDTDHHEVRVSMDDFFGALPRLIWHEDEPIAWPSSVSLYFVSQLGGARSQSSAHRRRQRRALRRLRALRLHPSQ